MKSLWWTTTFEQSRYGYPEVIWQGDAIYFDAGASDVKANIVARLRDYWPTIEPRLP